jgi:hypothetical protein
MKFNFINFTKALLLTSLIATSSSQADDKYIVDSNNRCINLISNDNGKTVSAECKTNYCDTRDLDLKTQWTKATSGRCPIIKFKK